MAPVRPERVPQRMRRFVDGSLLGSFHHAFQGILYATRTQRNMRIHLILGGLVLLATLYLRLQRQYVVAIVVLVAVVLAMELMNTAIEAVVDLMTVAHHPLAKIAKDSAAGAVFMVSLAAVIIGYLTFYEGITAASARVYESLAQAPAHLAFVSLALVAIATVFAKAYAGGHSMVQGGIVSGHAALAFAAATLIALFVQNPLVGLLAFFLAFLVAQSRVEGGIHSTLEVVLGGLIGATLSYAVFLVARVPHVL